MGLKNNGSTNLICLFVFYACRKLLDFDKSMGFGDFIIKSLVTDPIIHVFNGEYWD